MRNSWIPNVILQLKTDSPEDPSLKASVENGSENNVPLGGRASPLPSGWDESCDLVTGHVYYIDPISCTTTVWVVGVWLLVGLLEFYFIVFFIQWSDPRGEPLRKQEKEVQERQHEKYPVSDEAPHSSNLSVRLSFKCNRQ